MKLPPFFIDLGSSNGPPLPGVVALYCVFAFADPLAGCGKRQEGAKQAPPDGIGQSQDTPQQQVTELTRTRPAPSLPTNVDLVGALPADRVCGFQDERWSRERRFFLIDLEYKRQFGPRPR